MPTLAQPEEVATKLAIIIVLACAAMSVVAAATPMSLSVTVAEAEKDDPRWRAVAQVMDQLADRAVLRARR